MKHIFPIAILFGLFATLAAGVRAQLKYTAAYGVWTRGDRYDVTEFPYRGTEIDMFWETIQPSEDIFDWNDFDAALEKTAGRGRHHSQYRSHWRASNQQTDQRHNRKARASLQRRAVAQFRWH